MLENQWEAYLEIVAPSDSWIRINWQCDYVTDHQFNQQEENCRHVVSISIELGKPIEALIIFSITTIFCRISGYKYSGISSLSIKFCYPFEQIYVIRRSLMQTSNTWENVINFMNRNGVISNWSIKQIEALHQVFQVIILTYLK